MVERGRSTLVDFIRTSPEKLHQLPISLTFFDTKKEAKKYSPLQGLPAGGGCKQIIAARRRLFLCFGKAGRRFGVLSAGAWRKSYDLDNLLPFLRPDGSKRQSRAEKHHGVWGVKPQRLYVSGGECHSASSAWLRRCRRSRGDRRFRCGLHRSGIRRTRLA